MKFTALFLGISLIVFFWGEIKGAVAPGPGNNKKEKSMGKGNSLPESPGIRIVKRWEMPELLTEISGVSYVDADRFACVQDELGTIFIYNTKTSTIEKEIPFGDIGDYEGIAMVNEVAWVIRADGRLFEVNNINTGKPEVKEYATHLTIKQNVEAVGYDKNNNRLLLTIKDGEPGNKEYKGIYSFDLVIRKMPAQPVFKIDLQHEVFSNGNNSKKKNEEFMPTAIALHPVSREIYITDGPSGKLLVMDAEGNIKKLYQLNKNEFSQPEGITINPDGEIFIANEGKKDPGAILKIEIAE